MKKFYKIALSSIIIVTIWWVSLTLFGSYQVKTYGVTPTFPYYETLLSETDEIHAVWAHFDGAHYLHLAKLGYDGTGIQAFFPVYPMMIRGLHSITGISMISAGRLISFISLVGILTCLFYLLGSPAKFAILALLVFPTSFYLAAMYTESLFLFEVVLFFLLLKQKRYLPAAAVAGLASGTRVIGVLLSLSLLIELYPRLKLKQYLSSLVLLLISMSGFFAYAYFLWHKYNDPLLFMHVQSLFGAGRTDSEFVSLPQVLIRYLKMIISVDPSTWLYQRVWLELVIFVGAVWLWFRKLKQIPLSQSVFVGLAILLPTLSGTLSSFPRYAIILVPFLAQGLSKRGILIYLAVSLLLLGYLFARFASGTFVA